jgi:hypothetical protein
VSEEHRFLLWHVVVRCSVAHYSFVLCCAYCCLVCVVSVLLARCSTGGDYVSSQMSLSELWWRA